MDVVVGLNGAKECAADVQLLQAKLQRQLKTHPDMSVSAVCASLQDLYEKLQAVDEAAQAGDQRVEIIGFWEDFNQIIKWNCSLPANDEAHVQGATRCAGSVKILENKMEEYVKKNPDSSLSPLCANLKDMHKQLTATTKAVPADNERVDVIGMWECITNLIVSMGEFCLHLDKELTSVKNDHAELKKDHAELKNDHAELKNDNAELKKDVADLKKREADWIFYADIGEWLSQPFEGIIPNSVWQKLSKEYEDYSPYHWACDNHKLAKGHIKTKNVDPAEFDIIRNYRGKRNTDAHGSDLLEVKNFGVRYDTDLARLEARDDIPDDHKKALCSSG